MRRVLSSCSLSLEAVKYGHTISAVGVEPCTGRLYFSGEGGVRLSKNPRGETNLKLKPRQAILTKTIHKTPAGRRIFGAGNACRFQIDVKEAMALRVLEATPMNQRIQKLQVYSQCTVWHEKVFTRPKPVCMVILVHITGW